MTHTLRVLIRLAEAQGLRYCGVLDGKAHFRLIFENRFGQRMIKLAPHGGRYITSSPRQERNSRAQFKRFARGETHGLMVLPPQVITCANDSATLTRRAG